MENKIPGVFVGDEKSDFIAELNRVTNEWTMQAARGECGWICSDCCVSFPEGMPNECAHGQDKCTKIIMRDKIEAAKLEAESWRRVAMAAVENSSKMLDTLNDNVIKNRQLWGWANPNTGEAFSNKVLENWTEANRARFTQPLYVYTEPDVPGE